MNTLNTTPSVHGSWLHRETQSLVTTVVVIVLKCRVRTLGSVLTACLLLFLFCDKNTWQKQLMREKAYFCLLVESVVHHQGSCHGVEGLRSHCIHNQDAEWDERLCSTHFHYFIHSVWDSSPWNGTASMNLTYIIFHRLALWFDSTVTLVSH